jgi:hypothetical protein
VQQQSSFLKLRKVIADGGYTDEQLYNCDETALYYKLLANKSLYLKKAPSKAGMKTNEERVSLLLCASKTGNHKLNPFCIGKSRSPQCFKHVNMNSQPVIYKNSSCAWITCDIFASWFENEFVPSVRCHLCSKKLEEKALLVWDHCPAHPADVLKLKDGKIQLIFLPKNMPAKPSIAVSCLVEL